MTKREIAHQMNISEATLQRWKSGVSFPELPNLEKLAKILNVDEKEFYLPEKPVLKEVPMQTVLNRIASIPECIYKLAEQLNGDEKAWKDVESMMRAHLKRIEKDNANPNDLSG